MAEQQRYNIALIGCGNLAGCLAQGLIQQETFVRHLYGFDIDARQSQRLKDLNPRLQICHSIEEMAAAEAIVFCVKPQQMKEATNAISALMDPQQLLISVAAGIDTQALEAWTGTDQWVRSMPNLAVTVNLGMTALYAGPAVSPAQRCLAEKIFSVVGQTLWIEQEEMMSAITALSGSGPAYFFYVMQAMQEAAQKLGIEHSIAQQLVAQTALGAVTMAQTNKDWAGLCEKVASKGGTTESALNVFKEHQLQQTFYEAIAAAQQRCEALSRQQAEQKRDE